MTKAQRGSKILYVATGTRQWVFIFARKCYDVFRLGLSETILEAVKKKNKHKNTKFDIADATNLPFENNSFAVSSISFTLYEMPLSIREELLEKIVRIIKPTGIIVIADYNLP